MCRAGPALRAEATAQAPYGARAGLAQALLNGSCLGPARQTQPIWPSIPPHDNDGLTSVATTSFVILLPSSPLMRSCIHLRATTFSVEGVAACASSPYSSDTSPDTDSRSCYCMFTRTFHIIHASSFSPLSDVPFVLPAFALFFLPNLLPQPTVAIASRPTLIDVGTGRVGHAHDLCSCVPSRRT
jgi:hypothetical protein